MAVDTRASSRELTRQIAFPRWGGVMSSNGSHSRSQSMAYADIHRDRNHCDLGDLWSADSRIRGLGAVVQSRLRGHHGEPWVRPDHWQLVGPLHQWAGEVVWTGDELPCGQSSKPAELPGADRREHVRDNDRLRP